MMNVVELQDILSAVIELAASRSHQPGGDFLPFHLISRCLGEVSQDRRLSSRAEKVLFQVVLLMSSEAENSLTWWEKLANFDRYFNLVGGNKSTLLDGPDVGLFDAPNDSNFREVEDTFSKALGSTIGSPLRGRSPDRFYGSVQRSHSMAYRTSGLSRSPTSRRSVSQPRLILSTKLPVNPAADRNRRYSKEVSVMSPSTLEEGARLSATLNGRGFGAAEKGFTASQSHWNELTSPSTTRRQERNKVFDQNAAFSSGDSRATLYSMQKSQAYDSSVRYLSLSGTSDLSVLRGAGGFDDTISANIPRSEPMLTPNEQRQVREAEANEQFRRASILSELTRADSVQTHNMPHNRRESMASVGSLMSRRDSFMSGHSDFAEDDGERAAFSDEETAKATAAAGGGSRVSGLPPTGKRSSVVTNPNDDDNISVQSKGSRAGSVAASTRSANIKQQPASVAGASSRGTKKGTLDGNDSDSTIESKSSRNSSNLGTRTGTRASVTSNAAKSKVTATAASVATEKVKSAVSSTGTVKTQQTRRISLDANPTEAASGARSKSPTPNLAAHAAASTASSVFGSVAGQPSPLVQLQGHNPLGQSTAASVATANVPSGARSTTYSVGFSAIPFSSARPAAYASSVHDDITTPVSARTGVSFGSTGRSSSRYSLAGSRVSLDDPVVRDLFIDSQMGWRPENPADASAALHVFTLIQNWLSHKRFRKTVEDTLFSSNRKGKRRWPEVVGADPEMRNRSAAIMLHSHFTNLSDVVHSLYGCEQWLRKKLRDLITSEALAETFYAWGAFTGVLSVARHHWDTSIRRKLVDRFAGNLIRNKLNRKRVKRMVGRIESVPGPALLSPSVIWAYWLPKVSSRGQPLPAPQLRPPSVEIATLRRRFAIRPPEPITKGKGGGSSSSAMQEAPTTYEEDCLMMDEYMDRISLLFAFRRLRHRLVYLKKVEVWREQSPFHKKKIAAGKWKLMYVKYKMMENARESRAMKLYRALVVPHLLRHAVNQFKLFKRYMKIENNFNEGFRARYATTPMAPRALRTLMSPWKVRCFYTWLQQCYANGLSPEQRLVANAHRAKTCSRSYLRRWRQWCLQVAAQRVPQGGLLLPGGGFGLEHLLVQHREKWRGENLDGHEGDASTAEGLTEDGLPQCPNLTPITTADGEGGRFESFDIAPHALSTDMMSPVGVGRGDRSSVFSKAPTPYRPRGQGQIFQRSQQRFSGTFQLSFASSTVQFSSYTQKPISQSHVLVIDGRRQLVTGTAASARFALRMANLSRALWRWRAFARSGASRVYFSAGDFYRSEDIADSPANIGGQQSNEYVGDYADGGADQGIQKDEGLGSSIGSRNCEYSVRQRKAMLSSRFVTSCKFIRNRSMLGRTSNSSLRGGRSLQGRFRAVPEEGYIAQTEGAYAELVVRPDDPASEKIRSVKLVQLNFKSNKIFLKTFLLTNPLGYVGRAKLSTGRDGGEAMLQRARVPPVISSTDGVLCASAPLLVRYTRRWLLHVKEMRKLKRKAAAVNELKRKSILKEFLFFWKIEYRSATHRDDAKLNTFIFALKRERRMRIKARQNALMIEDHTVRRNLRLLLRAYRRATASRHDRLVHFLSAIHGFPYADSIIWKASRLIKSDGLKETVGFSRHSGASMAALAASRLAPPVGGKKRRKPVDERLDTIEIYQKYSIALFVSDSVGKFLRARRLFRRWRVRAAFLKQIRRLLQPKAGTDKLRVLRWLKRMVCLRGKHTTVTNKRAAACMKHWRSLASYRKWLRKNLRHAFSVWKKGYRFNLLLRALTPPYRLKIRAAFLRWKIDYDSVQNRRQVVHRNANNNLRRDAWAAMVMAIDSIRAERFLKLRKAVRKLVAVRYSRQSSRAQMLLVYFHRLRQESDRRFRERKALYLLWKTVLLMRGMRGLMGGLKKKMKERKRRKLLSMTTRMKKLVNHLAQLSSRFAPNDLRLSTAPSFAESLQFLLAPIRSSIYSEYGSASPRGPYARFARTVSISWDAPSKRESEVFQQLFDDNLQAIVPQRNASTVSVRGMRIRTSIASVRRAVPSTLEMIFEPQYGYNSSPNTARSRLSSSESAGGHTGIAHDLHQLSRGSRRSMRGPSTASTAASDYGYIREEEAEEGEEEEEEDKKKNGRDTGRAVRSRSTGSANANDRKDTRKSATVHGGDFDASSSDILISSDDSESEVDSDQENFEHDIFGNDEEQRAQAQSFASRAASRQSSRNASRTNSQANSRRTTMTNLANDPSFSSNLASLHQPSPEHTARAAQEALSRLSTRDDDEDEAEADEEYKSSVHDSSSGSRHPSVATPGKRRSSTASRHDSVSSAEGGRRSSRTQQEPLSSLTQDREPYAFAEKADLSTPSSRHSSVSDGQRGLPSPDSRRLSVSPSARRSLDVRTAGQTEVHDASPKERRLSIAEEVQLLSQPTSRRSSFSSTASASENGRRRSSTASNGGGIPPLSPHSFTPFSRESSPHGSQNKFFPEDGSSPSRRSSATGGADRRSSVASGVGDRRSSVTGGADRRSSVASDRRSSVTGGGSRRSSANSISQSGGIALSTDADEDELSNYGSYSGDVTASAIEALERGSPFQPVITDSRSHPDLTAHSSRRRSSVCSASDGRRGSDASYHSYHHHHSSDSLDDSGRHAEHADEEKQLDADGNRLQGLVPRDRRCSTASVDLHRRDHPESGQRSPHRASSPVTDSGGDDAVVHALEEESEDQAASAEQGARRGSVHSHGSAHSHRRGSHAVVDGDHSHGRDRSDNHSRHGRAAEAASSPQRRHSHAEEDVSGDNNNNTGSRVVKDKREHTARFAEDNDDGDVADERKDGHDRDEAESPRRLSTHAQTPRSEASTNFSASEEERDERRGSRGKSNRISHTPSKSRRRRSARRRSEDDDDDYGDEDDEERSFNDDNGGDDDSRRRDDHRGKRNIRNDYGVDYDDEDANQDEDDRKQRPSVDHKHSTPYDMDRDNIARSRDHASTAKYADEFDEQHRYRDPSPQRPEGSRGDSPSRWTPGRRAYEERRRRAEEESTWERSRQLHPHENHDDYARFRFLSAYEGSHLSPMQKGEVRVGGGHDSGIGGVRSPPLQGFPAGYQTRREFGDVQDEDVPVPLSNTYFGPAGVYGDPGEASFAGVYFNAERASTGAGLPASLRGGSPTSMLFSPPGTQPTPTGAEAEVHRDYQGEYLQWIRDPTRRHYHTRPWYLKDFLQMRFHRSQRATLQRRQATAITNPLVIARQRPRQLVAEHPNVRSHKVKSDILKASDIVSRVSRKQFAFRLWRELSGIGVELRWLADAHWRSAALRRYFVHFWAHRQRRQDNKRQKLAFSIRKFRVALAARAVGKRLNIAADGYHAHALARRFLTRWRKFLAKKSVVRHRAAFAEDFCIARRAALGFISLKVNTVRIPGIGADRYRDRPPKERRHMSMAAFSEKPKAPRPAPRPSISIRHRELLSTSNQPSPINYHHQPNHSGENRRASFWASTPPKPDTEVLQEASSLARGISQIRIVGTSPQQHSFIVRSAMKSAAKAVQTSIKRSLKATHVDTHGQRRASMSSPRASAANSRRNSFVSFSAATSGR